MNKEQKPDSSRRSNVFYSESSLPEKVVNDDSLMQYAIKGSDEQWEKVLEGKEISESGTIQIQSVRGKRKQVDDEEIEKEAERNPASKKQITKKRKKKGRRSV